VSKIRLVCTIGLVTVFMTSSALCLNLREEWRDAFKVQWANTPVEGEVHYESIRDIDFRNRIYALRDSPPGFVELRDGKHETGITGDWEDIGLKSVHYCGEIAIVEIIATWIGGSSMNTSHVRVFELLSPPNHEYKILMRTEIDFGWVPEKPIAVDCEKMELTMYSATKWMVRDENRMFVGRFNLKTMDIEAVEEMPIKAKPDQPGGNDH